MSADTRSLARALRRAELPELDLVVRGVAVAAMAAVPALGVAALLRGAPGLRGAGLAAALVVGMFAVSGIVLVCVALRAPDKLPAVSLVGAIVRMIAYGAVLAALDGADGIDRASTVLATCLLLAVTLIYEARSTATRPGFYWLRTPAPNGARSNERTRG